MNNVLGDTRPAVRKFNAVLDDLLAHFDDLPFDRRQRISTTRAVREPVWYCADGNIKIAYLPPQSHHEGVLVPSVHVRVYHSSWIRPVRQIYRRHGLTAEVFDHELFGKYDIDAELN